MTTRMLIDARHPEETRVAVVNGSRIEEFDFEAAEKKQIKGNIYLAKVTRVEPSLQAAFVEYGGNRHGFLAFSEIHPDYYQIPREDRERLLREEQAIEAEEMEAVQYDEADGHLEEVVGGYDPEDAHHDEAEAGPAPVEADHHHDDHHTDRLRERRMALRRRYKIQDVIKRRQVLLIQVVKEERGNKGAALTTYLSLAGRYCVLMPNTSHGGGISRKINSLSDRRRLKSIVDELALPPGMACIVRTAGLSRGKTEIRRDFDYLTRLWDDIRELTLTSTAPALIHEDSDLIKRSVRDVYSRDIEEILVEGERGYRQAREYMKLLMPGHARRVKQYVDPIPLFQRGQVESQLNAMFNPVVQLKSGGYIVINQTEALVAIDINSGRSTREHNIEETAYKTNCEAADEIARQLRLRDLAGLVVIDFIDMESSGNIRRVERTMKEALGNDRARIQVGRISSFGLMELSRQRLRTGVLEASTHVCPMCEGAGVVRSVPSAALAAIRGLEEEAVRGRASVITLRAARDVAVYILNRKRADIVEIEDRYGVRIDVVPDDSLIVPHFGIETSGPAPDRANAPALTAPPIILEEDDDDLPEEEEDEAFGDDAFEEEQAQPARKAEGQRGRGRGGRSEARPAEPRADARAGGRKRRRRGGRGRSGAEGEATPAATQAVDDADYAAPDWEAGADAPVAGAEGGSEGGRKRRRRGRRGGKNRDLAQQDAVRAIEIDAASEDGVAFVEPLAVDDAVADPAAPVEEAAPGDAPKRKRRAAKPKDPMESAEPAVAALPAIDEPGEKPRRGRKPKAKPAEEATAEPVAALDDTPVPLPAPKPRRTRKSAAAEPVQVGEAPSRVGDAAPERPQETPVSAEPASAPAPEATSNGTEDAPATSADSGRKGWWQRTFG